MARKFESEIRVIYGDTDAMGIVYYGNYARWFEIGRTEFLRQIGYPYDQMERDGIWLPVSEMTCKYHRPAMYDDVLTIVAWLDELGGASVVMGYEIKKKETGETLVTGKTRHGITDHQLKPIRLKRTWPELYAVLEACASGR